MSTLSKSKEIAFLGTRYRITKYFGPTLLKIERYQVVGMFEKMGWKEIYFGHGNPIVEAVKFFEDTLDDIKSD